MSITSKNHRGVKAFGCLLAGLMAFGVTVTLAAGAPNWVAGFSVNGDGNLVLAIKPKGMMLIVR